MSLSNRPGPAVESTLFRAASSASSASVDSADVVPSGPLLNEKEKLEDILKAQVSSYLNFNRAPMKVVARPKRPGFFGMVSHGIEEAAAQAKNLTNQVMDDYGRVGKPGRERANHYPLDRYISDAEGYPMPLATKVLRDIYPDLFPPSSEKNPLENSTKLRGFLIGGLLKYFKITDNVIANKVSTLEEHYLQAMARASTSPHGGVFPRPKLEELQADAIKSLLREKILGKEVELQEVKQPSPMRR